MSGIFSIKPESYDSELLALFTMLVKERIKSRLMELIEPEMDRITDEAFEGARAELEVHFNSWSRENSVVIIRDRKEPK